MGGRGPTRVVRGIHLSSARVTGPSSGLSGSVVWDGAEVEPGSRITAVGDGGICSAGAGR